MENDKPSNPQADKSGGDLIEEMARLMARDASDSRPESGISANDDSQPSWRPLPATETPSVMPEPKIAAPEPVSARPEPSATPPARQEPSISADDDAPSWMPRPIKPAAAETQPVEVPRIQTSEPEAERPAPKPEAPAPRIEVPQMEVPQMAPRPVAPTNPAPAVPSARAPEPETQSGSRFEFDFGFDQKPQDEPKPQPGSMAFQGAAPKEPEIEMPDPAPAVAPQSAAPSAEPALEEDDPIAELIRAQLHTPSTQGGLQDSAAQHSTAHEASKPATSGATPQSPATDPAAQDRFSVSPVFGLGGKVAPTQVKSTSGSAALDEIENLIGNAVRLDGQDAGAHDSSARDAVEGPRPAAAMPRPQQAATQAPQQAAPQPAARPAPRPAAIEIEDNVAAAEAAIHAAMQDGVAESDTSGLLRDDYSDDAEPVLAEGRARSRSGFSLGRWLVPVAALLLLGVVVYGIYAFISGGSAPTGDAPLISASNDPSKAAPEPTSDQGADQSVVLDGQNGDAADERLVSRDQSQENADPIRQIITADTDENGLANRKVRTVTVRPDGTIIQGDDQVAGGEELGVDRPNVPALPEGAVDSDLADTTVASLTSDNADENASAVNLVEVNGSSVPYPAPRITDREAKLAAATPSTPTTPASNGAVDLITNTPAQTTQTSAPAAGAWVQLASQRSQGAAEDTAAVLTRQFGSLFNGQQLQIQRADLGDRGVFYRIMLPATSLTEATNICTRIQSAGGNCFPRNN